MRAVSARLGWLALCLVPLGVGFGRLFYIYLVPAQGTPYQYRSVALSGADALILLTATGWLGWRWGSRGRLRMPRGTNLVLAALALLTLTAAISVASAYDRLLAVGVTVQLGVLLVFFFAATELLVQFPRQPLLWVAAIAVVGQSLLAGWQAAAQTTAPAGGLFNGWVQELTSHDQGASVVMLPIVGRWLRSYGSFPHPNILGGFLAISLAVLAIHEDPHPRRPQVVALAMGFAAVVLTFSRATWLAVLLGALTWLVAGRIRVTAASVRGRVAFATVVVLLVLVAVVRVASLGSPVERNSIETRLFYNSVGWQVVATGIPAGAGNLVVAQQHLLGASAAGSEPAHDVFLIALAELGPLGLVAWLGVFASLLATAWLRRGEPQGSAGPLVAVTVLAPLLLFDHYLWTQSAGRVLTVWTLVMLLYPGSARDMGRGLGTEEQPGLPVAIGSSSEC